MVHKYIYINIYIAFAGLIGSAIKQPIKQRLSGCCWCCCCSVFSCQRAHTHTVYTYTIRYIINWTKVKKKEKGVKVPQPPSGNLLTVNFFFLPTSGRPRSTVIYYRYVFSFYYIIIIPTTLSADCESSVEMCAFFGAKTRSLSYITTTNACRR